MPNTAANTKSSHATDAIETKQSKTEGFPAHNEW